MRRPVRAWDTARHDEFASREFSRNRRADNRPESICRAMRIAVWWRFDSDARKENGWSRFQVGWCILAGGKLPGTVPLSEARGLRVLTRAMVTLCSRERRFLPVQFVKQTLRKRNRKL